MIEVHSGKQVIKGVRLVVGSLLEEVGFMLEHATCKNRSTFAHLRFAALTSRRTRPLVSEHRHRRYGGGRDCRY